MRKSILVALSLLVSSFAFSSAQASQEVKWECDNPYGTKKICESYHYFKLEGANKLIAKLRVEGYDYAASRLIEMRNDMAWGLKYAQANNKRLVREFLPAATEGMANLKYDTKKARKKHAEINRLYKICAKGAEYYDWNTRVWLGEIDDDSDDHDDHDDSDDHDDHDDSDDHDDADDFDDSDDHDDSDDFDDSDDHDDHDDADDFDDSDDHDDADDFDDDNEADDHDDHDDHDDADDFDDDNEIDDR